MSSTLRNTSFEYGANAVYIAEVYEKYLQDPNSVSADWQDYFRNFGDTSSGLNDAKWGKKRSQVVGFITDAEKAENKKKAEAQKIKQALEGGANQDVLNSIHAHMLIRAYRVRGHMIADLDPLGLSARQSTNPELDYTRYGFTDADLDVEIALDGWLGFEKLTLRQIIDKLKQSYSNKFTLEYTHIQSLEKKEWLENRVESSLGRPSLSAEEKKLIFQQLLETVGFEEFLHKKFPGAKRFSAEGGEGLMPCMNFAIAKAAELGLEEVVLGMPHRGRLNVLTAFMGKPYVALLSEFNGNLAMPDDVNSSGDVKYHQGFSSDKEFGGRTVHLSLTSNPSHLETVNTVVTGKVRAKQDQRKDFGREKVMGLLLHGDAAFCGQGVVMETLSLSELDGYETGGTVHIVVNNQVGFTTNPAQGHKSPYPTDIAMMIQAPIFHVNGDDPEAVVHAAQIAAEYRAKFKQDVIIDLWCYRKHGHNEGDEPRWTQPLMYAVIDKKQTPREIYAQTLVSQGVLTQAEVDARIEAFNQRLESALARSNDYKPEKADMLEGKWTGITKSDGAERPKIETGVDRKTLEKIGKVIATPPAGVELHKGVTKVLENRAKMIETGKGFDWGSAELLAFGAILNDGFPIRLSGQDCIRGTFSHRHAGVFDQKTAEVHFPINNISADKKLEVLNSNLSEYGVLGYEYGYSSAEPNALVLWEGQFGDFANGAQIIIDQYIVSAEIKWLRMSGLVMLLPHGYEGQGPEHSSARLERFLQLCAENNIIVANCTTPANYFHILRRQVCRDFRKPLVLMTPKSLLRHKLAVSDIEEMSEGSTFKRVLPEIDKLNDKKVRKAIVCTGKVYYDLLEARRERKIDDVAIIRCEQLYPFPDESLKDELVKYKNADVVWVQEEPENMGAWHFIDRKLEKVLVEVGGKCTRPSVVARPEAAATACGYMKVHKHQQDTLINQALA